MKNFETQICPNCGSQKFKGWQELTEDEKILVSKLPSSAEFTHEERLHHCWCIRCWNEITADLWTNI